MATTQYEGKESDTSLCNHPSSVDAYGGEGGIIAKLNCGTTATPAKAHDVGGLPLTGLDIGIIVLGALIIIGLGLLLRKTSGR